MIGAYVPLPLLLSPQLYSLTYVSPRVIALVRKTQTVAVLMGGGLPGGRTGAPDAVGKDPVGLPAGAGAAVVHSCRTRTAQHPRTRFRRTDRTKLFCLLCPMTVCIIRGVKS